MMNSKRMNILYQCDDNYAAITGVSMTSLLENNKNVEDIHIYLLNDRISKENQQKFLSLARQYGRTLDFLDMAEISDRLSACGAPKWLGSYAAYGRLYAIGMIPEEIDRLLYLDSDTVVTMSLDELYTTDLEGNVCGMVQDTAPYLQHRYIGHRKNDIYFNSGVILFDAAEWKQAGCEASVPAEIDALRLVMQFPDQDLLNHMLKGRIKRLSPRYNFFIVFLISGIENHFYIYSLDKMPDYYSREEITDAAKNAAIYHFLSFEKPWFAKNRCALADLWDHYLALSPWKGMKKIENPKQAWTVRAQRLLGARPLPVLKKLIQQVYVHIMIPIIHWEMRVQRRNQEKAI